MLSVQVLLWKNYRRKQEKRSSFARDYNAEALSRLSRMNFFFLLSMPQTGTSQSQIYYPA